MIVEHVRLRADVDAWFTGRDLGDGRPEAEAGGGNLAHRRPHRPADLARARAEVGRATATAPASWHLMHQIHGAQVAVVTAGTPEGAELRGVDAAVTTLAGRPLVVQVADCVPVLVAGPQTVAAVHAGRAGVARGIVAAAISTIGELGDHSGSLTAVIGPAIGGCCYEVPLELRDEVSASVPRSAATTTWGTPSLDLPGAVAAQLSDAGVGEVDRVAGCTRCDPQGRWFSHRADPGSGRQVGLVVRRSHANAPERPAAQARS